jgi:hypothetical protein
MKEKIIPEEKVHSVLYATSLTHYNTTINDFMPQCCNFLHLEFSSDHTWPTSMLITFQTVSPLCKTFVPLKHSTMAQGFITVGLLDHLKCFANGFA